MAVVTMRQLLESGVHFGHQTRRWNPKMKRFIFTERNGIYIIDLQQSLAYIDRAYEFVKETVAHGGTVLFVGTKKQAQEADRRAGDPRRHALRQPALARRHAHQLPDGLQAASSASRSSRRSTSTTSPAPACTKKELLHPDAASATKLEQDPRRHPRHDQGPVAPCGSSTPRRSTSPSTRPASCGIPVIAHPRHQLRPRRGRLPDPGQRRRHPLRRPADPRRRRRRRRGPHRPHPARQPATEREAPEEPLAEWERELLEGSRGRQRPPLPRPPPRLLPRRRRGSRGAEAAAEPLPRRRRGRRVEAAAEAKSPTSRSEACRGAGPQRRGLPTGWPLSPR